VCGGAFATEVFSFGHKPKGRGARQLRESQQKVAQLQSDLDQLKSSSVATLSTENARLRAENQGLTRKFSQLQLKTTVCAGESATNAAITDLTRCRATAAGTLQAMQAENQQAATATEATAEQSMSPAAQLNTCINNLRQIDAAKQQWAWKMTKLRCRSVRPGPVAVFIQLGFPGLPFRRHLYDQCCRWAADLFSPRSRPAAVIHLFLIFILGFCRHSPRLSVP